jgi:hypothetical protein
MREIQHTAALAAVVFADARIPDSSDDCGAKIRYA